MDTGRKISEGLKIGGKAFAVLYNPGRSITWFGGIVDASEKGLTLTYIGASVSPAEALLLRILSPRIPDLCLKDISCKIIHDELVLDFSSDELELRRCCVRFGKLNREQKKHLHYFFQRHGTPELSR